MFTYIGCCLALLLVLHNLWSSSAFSHVSNTSPGADRDKMYCIEAKNKYKIVPGESFGDMPAELQGEFMRRKCDQYFCEPNILMGKGVYKCIPLQYNNLQVPVEAQLPLLPGSEEEVYCIEAKKRYGIIPGQSFGSMPMELRDKYLDARCYRFFCEPHERAGRGVFQCIPLKKNHIHKLIQTWS